MYLWSPCQQLTGYGGREYVPDASTRPLPHFRGELGTIGNHEVLQAVGTRPRELLVIWKVKKEKKIVKWNFTNGMKKYLLCESNFFSVLPRNLQFLKKLNNVL